MNHLGDLAIVGVGNMGSAMVDGLVRAGMDPRRLTLVEAAAGRRDTLSGRFPDSRVVADVERVTDVVVAVKPGEVAAVCSHLAARGMQRVISIAAGVTLAQLEAACGTDVAVVRAMPNTPAVVGLSTTAMVPGSRCTPGDAQWANDVLAAMGVVVTVAESEMDAFTGLIGSGPAYVFYVAEALLDAARDAGLPQPEQLVSHLLVGAAALVAREPDSPAELRRRVTSPNGTTAAGISVLDERGVHDAIVAAVHRATQRSRDMGTTPG